MPLTPTRLPSPIKFTRGENSCRHLPPRPDRSRPISARPVSVRSGRPGLFAGRAGHDFGKGGCSGAHPPIRAASLWQRHGGRRPLRVSRPSIASRSSGLRSGTDGTPGARPGCRAGALAGTMGQAAPGPGFGTAGPGDQRLRMDRDTEPRLPGDASLLYLPVATDGPPGKPGEELGRPQAAAPGGGRWTVGVLVGSAAETLCERAGGCERQRQALRRIHRRHDWPSRTASTT